MASRGAHNPCIVSSHSYRVESSPSSKRSGLDTGWRLPLLSGQPFACRAQCAASPPRIPCVSFHAAASMMALVTVPAPALGPDDYRSFAAFAWVRPWRCTLAAVLLAALRRSALRAVTQHPLSFPVARPGTYPSSSQRTISAAHTSPRIATPATYRYEARVGRSSSSVRRSMGFPLSRTRGMSRGC